MMAKVEKLLLLLLVLLCFFFLLALRVFFGSWKIIAKKGRRTNAPNNIQRVISLPTSGLVLGPQHGQEIRLLVGGVPRPRLPPGGGEEDGAAQAESKDRPQAPRGGVIQDGERFKMLFLKKTICIAILVFRFSGPRYPHAHKRGRRRRSLLRQDVKLLQLLLLSLWRDNDDWRSAGGDKVPGRPHEVALRDARAGAGADPEPGASGAEQRGRAAAGDGATPHTVRIHASQVKKMRHNCYSLPNGIQSFFEKTK